MCGRFACRLTKKRLQQACTYKASAPDGIAGVNTVPDWLDLSSSGTYQPSYNIGPTVHTPVLVCSNHWSAEEEQSLSERILVPMSWGLIPTWHKGDQKEFGLKTINCRVETILEKPTYKTPLVKGQRCVVLAEGFYEWKTEKGGKKPFYVYFPQPKEVNMSTRNWEQSMGEEADWTGPRLLTMAGLFETKTAQDGEKFLSYTVITRSSLPSLSWLHSRMPAILDGEEVIQKWLDNKNVPVQEALNLLESPVDLEWHPVSSVVGNVRNNSVDCVLPLKAQSSNVKSITNWFKPVNSSKKPSTESSYPAKKLKTEK